MVDYIKILTGKERITSGEYENTVFHTVMLVIMAASAIMLVFALEGTGPDWLSAGILWGILAWLIDNIVRINVTGSHGITKHCDRKNYPFK